MKKALIFLAILAVLALAIALGRRGGAGSGVEVLVEQVKPRAIRSSILASGKVTYDEKVTLTSEIIGIVNSVHVKEGQVVRKSDLLLEIRDEEFRAAVEHSQATVKVQQAQIERAKLNVELLDRQWRRSQQLFERKLIAREAFEKTEFDLDLARVERKSSQASLSQARAELEQAEKHLSKTRIRSPIDGVVTSLDLKEGETAIPSIGGIAGSTLMVIANPQSIYTQVNVDEADIGRVSVGDEAEVVAVAFPSTPLKGTLESMASSAKVAEGRQGLSFAVKIRLVVSAGIELRSGMSCRAEIFTSGRADLLAVPIQAIVVEEDRKANKTNYFVYLNRDNAAEKVPVSTGISDDKYQEITAGLKAGDQVIVGPDKVLQSLRPGAAVSVRAAAQPAA